MPCEDDALEMLATHRSVLEDAGLVPMEADDEVVLAMLDKQRTYELAKGLGIPAPGTLLLHSKEDVEAAASSFGFPLALKPTHSHHFAKHFPSKVLIVRDQQELADAFAETQRLGLHVLATEVVSGSDDRYCSYFTYLTSSGEPLFHFTKRKPRQFPVGFGDGTFHLTEWMPEVADLGLSFFRGVGVVGLANVEFKRDEAGTLRLIECNHRFTMANEQLRHAGVDVALVVYRHHTGGELPPTRQSTSQHSFWVPVKDLRTVPELRRRGELTFPRWLRSVIRWHHFPRFRWSDPMPSVMAGSHRLLRALRRTLRGASPQPAPAGPARPGGGEAPE